MEFWAVLEGTLGEKRYLILYFLSGLGGFFLFNLWNFIEVQQITSGLAALSLNAAEIYGKSAVDYMGNVGVNTTNPEGVELYRRLYIILRSPMLGASGAIFGVVAAFATLFPEAKIMMMFIPIPMKVKYLLPVIVIVSIFLGFSGSAGGIAHFAHVGGAIVGFLLARSWKKHLYRFH